MEKVLKKRECQKRYYARNQEVIRAKAKEYRNNLSEELKQQKRSSGLAYYYRHRERINAGRKVKRLNRTVEERLRDRLRKRESDRRRSAEARRIFDRSYYKQNRETILTRQRKHKQWNRIARPFQNLKILARAANLLRTASAETNYCAKEVMTNGNNTLPTYENPGSKDSILSNERNGDNGTP